MRRNRTALCIVRTWVEESSSVLRAEICITSDSSDGTRHRVVVTGAQEVERVFRDWLSSCETPPQGGHEVSDVRPASPLIWLHADRTHR